MTISRTQLNIGLLVVVAGLGAAVYFGEQKKKDEHPPLTALPSTSVNHILLEHAGSPAIRLEKKDGEWQITDPVKAQADTFSVNALLGLADTPREEMLEGDLDLKAMGLEPAGVTLTLNDQKLELGGNDPLKNHRYVRLGQQVSLIAAPSSNALDEDYTDLVSRSLLPPKADLVKIEMPGLTVEKNAAGAWVSPDHPEAEAAKLKIFTDAWLEAQSTFNEKAQPDAQGEPITLTLADGRKVELLKLAQNYPPLVENKALGLRYTLSSDTADKMLKLPEDKKPAPPPPSATPQPQSAAPAAPTPSPASAK